LNRTYDHQRTRRLDARDRHQLAVVQASALDAAAVGLELQPVADNGEIRAIKLSRSP